MRFFRFHKFIRKQRPTFLKRQHCSFCAGRSGAGTFHWHVCHPIENQLWWWILLSLPNIYSLMEFLTKIYLKRKMSSLEVNLTCFFLILAILKGKKIKCNILPKKHWFKQNINKAYGNPEYFLLGSSCIKINITAKLKDLCQYFREQMALMIAYTEGKGWGVKCAWNEGSKL